MNNDCLFIEDGYSVEFTIPAVPGLHGALGARARLALHAERGEFQRRNQGRTGEEQTRAAAELLSRHLEWWDSRRRDGTEVSVKDVAFVARLKPALLEKILDRILGYAPVEEEADRKNSPPASGS